MDKELVSIHCMAYNHAKYIKDCLEGFIKQKTNFKFTAYIGDDCSTDGTTDIIKEYEAKYPEIIKGIYRNKNIGVETNYLDLFKKCKGKYLIICEGDDYWTDENKLQKQVDFMEQNPDYSICFHPIKRIFEDKEEKNDLFPTDEMKKHEFNFENLLKYNFIQTNSALYRFDLIKNLSDVIPKKMIPGDWYVHLLFAKEGKIKYLDDVMAVYRIHPSGGWGNYNLEEKILKYQFKFFNFYLNVYKNIVSKDRKYRNIVVSKYRQMLAVFLKNKKYSKILLMMIYHPIFFAGIFVHVLSLDL